MRHLAPALLESTLRRGVSLEQFLGGGGADAGPTIRWIEIRPTEGDFEVWEFNAPDEGSQECADVYGFLGEDDDLLHGTFQTPAGALACAVGRGARAERWVNPSVLQDEYLDFVRAGRPADWPNPGAGHVERTGGQIDG
jgi:hypothetical protein